MTSKSIAHVETAKASNYLQQVCKHWSHRFAAKFDERDGFVDFEDSNVTLHAADGRLIVTVEAPEAQIAEVEGIVAEHIDRFAHREGPLVFDWARN